MKTLKEYIIEAHTDAELKKRSAFHRKRADVEGRKSDRADSGVWRNFNSDKFGDKLKERDRANHRKRMHTRAANIADTMLRRRALKGTIDHD